MTCKIDHDAENAIPTFLCAACNAESISREQRQALDLADAIRAASERAQISQPVARLP
jgi:hypothetical protein